MVRSQLEFIVSKVEALLKKTIKRNSLMRKVLGALNLRLNKFLRIKLKNLPVPIDNLLDSFSVQKSKVFFVQIGACDGIYHDPVNQFIKRDKWSGILIEPVKYLFQDLVSNYESISENLIFENVAISDKNEFRDFFYLKETSDGQFWKKMFGGFNRSHIPYEEEKNIIKEKIQCMTFQTLIKKHDIRKIDLLLIDTEGFDYEIIKTIDFSSIRPDILIYEWVNLNLKDNNQCIRHLIKNEYCLFESNRDVIALSDSICNLQLIKNENC